MNKEPKTKSLKISIDIWKILKEYCDKENKKLNKEVDKFILKGLIAEKEKEK